MDGRWKLAVAGGLILTGLVGCKSTTKPESTAMAHQSPLVQGKNTVYIPEPTEDDVKKDGPLAASTMILFANAWVDAVAKDPNKPAAERDRLLTQARGVYQEVLAREPKNVDALLSLGEMYGVTGEREKQLEIEQKAISLHGNNPKVWAWVAVRQSQVKNWDAACDSYQKAVKLDPENRMYRIHLGFTLCRATRYTEGYEWLGRAMKESEARYNMAMMMVHNGDVEKAKLELRLSLKSDPSFTAASDKLVALQNTPNGMPSAQGDVRTVGHQQ